MLLRVTGALGARLDTALARYAQYGFWGSVLVVRDRRIVLLKGYGLADATRGIRNTAATRLRDEFHHEDVHRRGHPAARGNRAPLAGRPGGAPSGTVPSG